MVLLISSELVSVTPAWHSAAEIYPKNSSKQGTQVMSQLALRPVLMCWLESEEAAHHAHHAVKPGQTKLQSFDGLLSQILP